MAKACWTLGLIVVVASFVFLSVQSIQQSLDAYSEGHTYLMLKVHATAIPSFGVLALIHLVKQLYSIKSIDSRMFFLALRYLGGLLGLILLLIAIAIWLHDPTTLTETVSH